MLIPKILAALLVVRQLDSTLPTSYCTPECPSCKSEYSSFNSSTACVDNSTFITDCSICQQCILTYNIDLGQTPASEQLEEDMVNILNSCENTTVSRKIESLQSDASRLSAALVASTTALSTTTPPSSTTPTPAITSPPSTSTHSWNSTDWETRCSTATWCSYLSIRRSESSAAVASSISAALANATSTPPLPGKVHPSPLNLTWIVGPIVGCVLGFATVFVVIYFTRRRYAASPSPPSTPSTSDQKEFADSSSTHSSPVAEKAQLHSECVEPKELESTELAELPALEPVGNELLSPKSGTKADGEEDDDDWPLPISPLPALFAASEIRDQRLGVERSGTVRHETFYHP